MSIEAKIIADSIANGVRLTTLQLTYHRLFHGEVLTHRVFTRNASSSRAIPTAKLAQDVIDNPAMPIFWGKNQSGMQAREQLDPDTTLVKHPYTGEMLPLSLAWTEMTEGNALWSMAFAEAGLHKQLANRPMEVGQWMRTIVTATEWTNFFNLRDEESAQPEFQQLAKTMRIAMDESEPVELRTGEWHLPYVDWEEFQCRDDITLDDWIKCSIARAARISYLNHDQSKPDITKDIALADRLISMGHMSPTEHQATPMDSTHWAVGEERWETGVTHMDKRNQLWSGNFRGWIQYRQTL